MASTSAPVWVTAACLLGRSTATSLTPLTPFSARVTLAAQWPQVIPLIFRTVMLMGITLLLLV